MSLLNDLKLQYKIGNVAQKLVFWNIGCFLFSFLVFYQYALQVFIFPSWVALSSEWSFFYLWTLVSYAFFHFGFLHLLFNMLMLVFSCRLFLVFFSEKQLIGVYFLGAIFSGVFFSLVFYFFKLPNVSLVGASAAIMAVLVATTVYQPLYNIKLLLIGNVKLWQITTIFLVLNILQFQLANAGSFVAHLGGALFGVLFIYLLKIGTDLSLLISTPTHFILNLSKKNKTPFKKVIKNQLKQSPKTTTTVVIKSKEQQQVDEILDKISKSGYDSLSASEKEFLFKAGK